MNKFRFYFILFIVTFAVFSCDKNDSPDVEPPRDYATQYASDIANIETYLKTYYITVVDHPGFPDDQDVTFTKIPEGGTQKSIWDQTTYELKSKEVKLHDITYKLYYLVLRAGVGQSPCNVDGVLTSYSGQYLEETSTAGVVKLETTTFEEVKFPQQIIGLYNTIKGWSETFPLFKTGTYTSNADGTVVHNDFGAGIMFIPSGLAYYNTGSGDIPSYVPLIFSFKLYEIKRFDFDEDGVLSYQEDLDGDGFMRSFAEGVANPDDTDKDGIPNFADVDDDGDNYTTKLEIKDGNGVLYSFDNIPSCDGNTTDPKRIKKHLDKNCH